MQQTLALSLIAVTLTAGCALETDEVGQDHEALDTAELLAGAETRAGAFVEVVPIGAACGDGLGRWIDTSGLPGAQLQIAVRAPNASIRWLARLEPGGADPTWFPVNEHGIATATLEPGTNVFVAVGQFGAATVGSRYCTLDYFAPEVDVEIALPDTACGVDVGPAIDASPEPGVQLRLGMSVAEAADAMWFNHADPSGVERWVIPDQQTGDATVTLAAGRNGFVAVAQVGRRIGGSQRCEITLVP